MNTEDDILGMIATEAVEAISEQAAAVARARKSEGVRTKATHFLKTWPKFFNAILDGSKTFEARRDDRAFKVGDELCLQEYDPKSGTFTEREIDRTISYILRGTEHVAPGYCILGLRIRAGERRTEPQWHIGEHGWLYRPDGTVFGAFDIRCAYGPKTRDELLAALNARALPPEPQAVAPGESWRMLEVGEVIQGGDEIDMRPLDNEFPDWELVNSGIIGNLVDTPDSIRRRVAPAPTAAETPTTDGQVICKLERELAQHAEEVASAKRERDAALKLNRGDNQQMSEAYQQLSAALATALTERNQALAAQAEQMQVLADIHDLATNVTLTDEQIVAAIAKRTRTHHTPT